MSEMDEIIREFLVESNEGLDQMDRDLVELEKDPTSSELLASIFRAIHTVKGTSGVLGFPKLESVAHVGESLLSRMRDGKLRLTGEITSALLAMVDAVRSILLEIEKNGQEGDRNYPEVIARVNSFISGEQQAASPERMRLGEILVTSGVSDKSIAEALDRQNQGDPRRLGELLVESGEAKPEVVLEALNRQEENRSSTASSIRVDLGLLDKVMNLVGELVLARNQVLQYTATQKDQAFVSTAQRLNLITTELQEGVMKTRMQPIGNVWNKFPRLVRDLAVSCGKHVRIDLEGSDTELDKTIIEAIKDPLMQVMQRLDNIEEVGRGIAVAFVATVYGVGAANFLFLPCAGKLKIRLREEQLVREMTLEGVVSILEGMNPRMLEAKLLGFLLDSESTKEHQSTEQVSR